MKARKCSEPQIYATGRHGCWGECRCGWQSKRLRTPAAVALAWANHMAVRGSA